jgi:hypothetical protein
MADVCALTVTIEISPGCSSCYEADCGLFGPDIVCLFNTLMADQFTQITKIWTAKNNIMFKTLKNIRNYSDMFRNPLDTSSGSNVQYIAEIKIMVCLCLNVVADIERGT